MGTKLKPFIGYFGSKYRIIKHYPAPRYDTIVEPFAGSAAYSVHYPEKKVILVEKDPLLAAVWRYLIKATSEQVMSIPLLPDADTLVSSLKCSEEEKLLIGYNIQSGDARPRNKVSNHCRDYRPPWVHHSYKDPVTGWQKPTSDTNAPLHEGYENFWGEKRRARIARQVPFIKHWRIIEGDYTVAPDVQATWFIDPPYERAGKAYRFNKINYKAVADFACTRKGEALVCESDGATWLPFKELGNFKSTPGTKRKQKSVEVIYYKEK